MVLSDNGKTFKATARFLNTVFKDKTVKEYLTTQGCQWIFNIEHAPWWGGVFEQMVQSTKRCLCKVVGRATLSYDELPDLLPHAANLVIIIYDVACMQSTPTYKADPVASYIEDT